MGQALRYILIVLSPNGLIRLEVEAMGHVVSNEVRRSLVFLLAEHHPGPRASRPAAEAGIILDGATLRVVERDTVKVIHQNDICLNEKVHKRPVEAPDTLEPIRKRQIVAFTRDDDVSAQCHIAHRAGADIEQEHLDSVVVIVITVARADKAVLHHIILRNLAVPHHANAVA